MDQSEKERLDAIVERFIEAHFDNNFDGTIEGGDGELVTLTLMHASWDKGNEDLAREFGCGPDEHVLLVEYRTVASLYAKGTRVRIEPPPPPHQFDLTFEGLTVRYRPGTSAEALVVGNAAEPERPFDPSACLKYNDNCGCD